MESKDKSTVSNEKKLKYLKTLNLSKDKIDEIIKAKGKTKIEIYNEDLSRHIIYTFKNNTSNNYFYHCNKRPKCKGKAKYDLKEEKFYITEKCDKEISHYNLNYEKFLEIIESNKLNKIDFSIKKIKNF